MLATAVRRGHLPSSRRAEVYGQPGPGLEPLVGPAALLQPRCPTWAALALAVAAAHTQRQCGRQDKLSTTACWYRQCPRAQKHGQWSTKKTRPHRQCKAEGNLAVPWFWQGATTTYPSPAGKHRSPLGRELTSYLLRPLLPVKFGYGCEPQPWPGVFVPRLLACTDPQEEEAPGGKSQLHPPVKEMLPGVFPLLNLLHA